MMVGKITFENLKILFFMLGIATSIVVVQVLGGDELAGPRLVSNVGTWAILTSGYFFIKRWPLLNEPFG